MRNVVLPGLPTPTETLHPAVEAYLDDERPVTALLVGGEAALSPAVADAVSALGIRVQRVSGSTRAATASALVDDVWCRAGPDDERWVVIDGYHEDGWAFGLLAATLSARYEAPLLLPTTGTGRALASAVPRRNAPTRT